MDNPETFKKMHTSPGLFAIVGGGITSPDNLLPHGEAFVRDYLVGVSWLKSVNVSWSGKVWLPDDFGHDSQLPSMLSALGVTGVSFGRVPGACNQGQDPEPSGSVSAHRVLLDTTSGGLDFRWKANDGSSVFTYYMPNGYCAGDGLYYSTCEPQTPVEMANCQCSSTKNAMDNIAAYIGVRQPLATTPYIYTATGCDFRVPLTNLVQTLTQWNTQRYPQTGIYAVSASFSHYVDLVEAYNKEHGDKLPQRNFHGTTPTTTFKPTPYWMGFYSSRTFNKQLHYETCKALLASETFLVVEDLLGLQSTISDSQIDSLWNLTTPSTHHDYITGTATDYVYLGEQLPLLTYTVTRSQTARSIIYAEIASALNTNPTANPSIIAFNQHGFPLTRLVSEVKLLPSATDEDKEYLKSLPGVQVTANGGFVSLVTAPSLGYNGNSPTDVAFETTLKVEQQGGSFVLENSYLKATINQTSNWAITSLFDKLGNAEVLSVGNALQFRNDNGNIYRFGYEEGCGFNNYNPTITPTVGTIVENGPVRIVISAGLSVVTSSWTRSYTLIYTLVQDEPFVRMSISGSAAPYTAVITQFTFNTNIDTYDHGTPYHWDYKSPFLYGLQNDFKVTIEATHDFIVPKASTGSILGAVYQNSTPGWGVLNSNSIVGVVLRNSPSDCAGKGAAGSDNDDHIVHYAIRVPSGLGPSSTGQALREARAFHTPLEAVFIPKAQFTTARPQSFSLASVQSPATGIITAAKTGEYSKSSYVFRVYYPENTPTNVVVAVNTAVPSSSKVRLVTALEEPIEGSTVSWSANRVSYKTGAALTTFQVETKP